MELEKRLEINKSYKERRNRAVAVRILSYGLFGQKRFQNLYLSCSLNCFYWALQIANFLHQRVAGLAMIIKFEQVHVIEYYEGELENGKTYAEQKYTKIVIKLTRTPTEEDKKEPGFNAGFDSANIKDELKELVFIYAGSSAPTEEKPKEETGPRDPEEIEEKVETDVKEILKEKEETATIGLKELPEETGRIGEIGNREEIGLSDEKEKKEETEENNREGKIVLQGEKTIAAKEEKETNTEKIGMATTATREESTRMVIQIQFRRTGKKREAI